MSLAEVEVIKGRVLRAMLVGSRVTCDPPVVGTDQDVLVLVKRIESCGAKPEVTHAEFEDVMQMHRELRASGWVLGGSGDQDDEFESWTHGDVNLILTASEEFYNLFVAATAVCKRLNILDKEDRKAVFRAVLYTECCIPLNERGEEETF